MNKKIIETFKNLPAHDLILFDSLNNEEISIWNNSPEGFKALNEWLLECYGVELDTSEVELYTGYTIEEILAMPEEYPFIGYIWGMDTLLEFQIMDESIKEHLIECYLS